MKTLKAISAAVFAAILMMSCGSNKNILTANALDGEWDIKSVNGKAVTADKQPYLGINMQEKDYTDTLVATALWGAYRLTKPENCLSDKLPLHG